ncbi:hypothetical protein KKB41_00920 [Patescibacteria group bacterium]|nr:hypothetical protein [Patescibacteria group bacterium]
MDNKQKDNIEKKKIKKEELAPPTTHTQVENLLKYNIVDRFKTVELRDADGKKIDFDPEAKYRTHIDEQGNLNLYKKLYRTEENASVFDVKTAEMLLAQKDGFAEKFRDMNEEEQGKFLDELEKAQLSLDDQIDILREASEEDAEDKIKELKEKRNSLSKLINSLAEDKIEMITTEELANLRRGLAEFITVPDEELKNAFAKLKPEQKKAYLDGLEDAIDFGEKIIIDYKEVLEDEGATEKEKEEARKHIREEESEIESTKRYLEKFK